MASLRAKLVGVSLLGLLLVIAILALLGGQHELARRPAPPAPPAPPVSVSAPASALAPAPAPAPTPTPSASRSKGDRDWAFFFRAGDTLSRMRDGSALGVVVRLERTYTFADGSAGPAYVVRSPDQGETIFDADELERTARIEAIREVGRPALGTPPR